MRRLSRTSHADATRGRDRGGMRGHVVRQLAVVIVLLALVAGLWFLPRTLSFGVSTPPAAIELRPAPTPAGSSRAPAPPWAVDESGDDEDDGGDAPDSNRAERRTNRESAPDTGTTGSDDEDDDDNDDEEDDDDVDDDD